MHPTDRLLFWRRWLLGASGGLVAFGTAMACAPALARRVFGLLIFGSADAFARVEPAAGAYVALAHGVIGALMAGWGLALLLIVRGPLRRGSREAWVAAALPLAAWFVLDTSLSLWLGFWRNALLNAGLAALFAVPLGAMWRDAFRDGRRVTSA